MSNSQYMHLLASIDLKRKLREIERSKKMLSGTYVSKDTARISTRVTRVSPTK